MIVNIINGGLECNAQDPAIIKQKEERIGFYKWFAAILHIKVGDEDCDCQGMGTY